MGVGEQGAWAADLAPMLLAQVLQSSSANIEANSFIVVSEPHSTEFKRSGKGSARVSANSVGDVKSNAIYFHRLVNAAGPDLTIESGADHDTKLLSDYN
jgi:hypothetical protein